MRIRPLASSSEGNAYLVSDGVTQFLLDCGLPIKQLKQATGYNLTSLAGCLVTHQHGDHAKAAADLMRAGVDVYMSTGTAQALALSGHRLKLVSAREQFALGSWTILPFEAIHDAEEPLNYLLAGPGGKLAYITDTAYCPYRFSGLTHILLEVNYARDILDANVESGALPAAMRRRIIRSHMGLDTAKDFLRANDLSQVREIWLIHLSDGNSDAARFKREVQGLTGKPVYVAEK